MSVVFEGINYPSTGIGPYEVNRGYNLDYNNKARCWYFQSVPDENTIYVTVRVVEERANFYRVEYNLYRDSGTVVSYPFSGTGFSPIENKTVYYPVDFEHPVLFGGTCTI